MAVNKAQTKAQVKVSKALSVFDKAKQEVEQAQEILNQGIKEDRMDIAQAEKDIEAIKNKILDKEIDIAHKQDDYKKNAQLIEHLQQFKS